MALIVCPDCEQEIGERAAVCIHCGSVIDEQARKDGAKAAMQKAASIIHGVTAFVLGVVGSLLAALVGSQLSWEDTSIAMAVMTGGGVGFVIGSVLGYFLAERAAGGPTEQTAAKRQGACPKARGCP